MNQSDETQPVRVMIVEDTTPTYRRSVSRLCEHLAQVGYEIHRKKIDDVAVGRIPDMLIVDDFSAVELRLMNSLVYGTSHPEMYDLPLAEDKRKKPKGPRGRWGNLK
ncbi:MAG: hypothetical protein WC117_00225 [Sphaerochaetaceae bacterium]